MRIKIKHFISFCLSVVICSMSLISFGTAATKGPGIVIDGTPVQFSSGMGEPFVDENNRTQVPLRVTMEAMGAKVDWDAEVRTAVVSKGSVTVRVPIGAEFVWVNGEKKNNDTAAVIVNSRTYLPIRIVAEALGADVAWDGASKTVKITTHGDPVAWVRCGESWYHNGEYYDSFDYVIKNNKISSYSNNLEVFSYVYNDRGQIEQEDYIVTFDDNGGGYKIVTRYTYNNYGLMTYELSREENLKTKEVYFNTETWYEYNSRGDVVKALVHVIDNDSWDTSTNTYTYDGNGRISQMIENNPQYHFTEGMMQAKRIIHNYHYNSYGRLVEENVTNVWVLDSDAYNEYEDIYYGYDANGNLVHQTINDEGFTREVIYSYKQI